MVLCLFVWTVLLLWATCPNKWMPLYLEFLDKWGMHLPCTQVGVRLLGGLEDGSKTKTILRQNLSVIFILRSVELHSLSGEIIMFRWRGKTRQWCLWCKQLSVCSGPVAACRSCRCFPDVPALHFSVHGALRQPQPCCRSLGCQHPTALHGAASAAGLCEAFASSSPRHKPLRGEGSWRAAAASRPGTHGRGVCPACCYASCHWHKREELPFVFTLVKEVLDLNLLFLYEIVPLQVMVRVRGVPFQ